MKRVFSFFTVLLIFNFLSSNGSFAQSGNKYPVPKIKFGPKHYVCYRTQSPMIIDGKIDEAIWAEAAWTDDFVDIEGSLKPKPRFRTRAKMLWDDNFFYFAAEMEEPHVWATLTKRDAVIFYDNDFEIFIDPDGDTHEYYEFEMNAFSTEWDLLLTKPYRDAGSAVDSWDIQGLQTAVWVDGTINDPRHEDKLWTLEVAMPWSVLVECAHKQAPPLSGDVWRVNFSRVEWQIETKDGKYRKLINPETGKSYPEDNWVWSPQGLINMHYPEMWGFVRFSENIAGTKDDEFVRDEREDIKWALRQIYYGEKNYFMKHGKYTTALIDIRLTNPNLPDWTWPPEIEITQSLFEARIKNKTNDETWHIDQDGRVWKK